MKIKVSSGYTGVISTGSYENSRPAYSAEVEFEIEEDLKNGRLAEIIREKQLELQEVCYRNFKQDEEKQIIERIERQRAGFHWIDIDGRKAPSVTSIIGWDEDFFVPPDELTQYASQGSIIDAQGRHFIKTGLWVQPKEIDDCWADLVILKKGSLQLSMEGWSFPAFLEKFPIKDMKLAETSFNREHFYGGTPDFTGIPVGWNKIKGYEEVKEVPTLFDWKRTAVKIKNGKQLAGYKNMEAYKGIEQAAIVELNDKTERGFSKPEFYSPEKLAGYFKMFLKDREAFKKRFNV